MNPWRGVAGLPRAVWALAATTFVNRVGTMVIPFLVLYLTGPLGFSSALAGSIVGVFGAASIVAAPISGRLADRFGATRVMGTSLVLSAVVLAAYPFVRGVWPVIAATVLFAAVSEAYRPASLSAVSLAARPEQRRAAFALNRLAINLGMSVGPALGGFLAAWSFTALFWVDGASSLAAAAVLAWAPVRAAGGSDPSPSDETAGEDDPHAAAARASRLGTAWHDRRLLYFLAAALPALVVFFQLTAALPLFLVRDLGFTAAFYGALFTLNTLIIVVLEVPLNVAMADWPAGRQLGLGAALVACGFGGMALTSDRAGIALTVIVWTFGEMVLLPAMAAYVAEIAPEARSGEYMGLFTMTFGFALVLAPPIGTFLLDRFGGGVLWTAMLALGLASAALLVRVAGPAHSR